MARDRSRLIGSAVLVILALGQTEVASASPIPRGDRDEAARAASLIATSEGEPSANDERFVVGSGLGLDTPCLLRNQGPILINLPIDRVVTNPSTSVATLKQNGYITDAVLTIMAYDVDYKTNERPIPERDKVYFNGHLVEEQYLQGSNNLWHRNTFRIPIEWVNFPSDPGDLNLVTPASNEIRIDIDTASGDSLWWCTAVDYVVLEFKATRPVILVHGMHSNGGTWSSPGIWAERLTQEGIPFSNGLNFYPNSTIQADEAVLEPWIQSAKNQWGVDKVALVCHSKGGLSARTCASNSDNVSDLVQIATPNLGSPLADLGIGFTAVPGAAVHIVSRVIEGWAGSNILSDLSTWKMRDFNRKATPNPNVKYTALGGVYGRTGALEREDFTSLVQGMEPGDGVVPLASALALPSGTPITFEPAPGNIDAIHERLITSTDVFNLLKDRAVPPALMRSGPGDTLRLQPIAGFWGLAALHDTLNVGSIQVDEAVPTLFSLVNPEGEVDFWLESPSGRTYQISTPPEPGFESGQYDLFGKPLWLYQFITPEVGTWNAYVSAFSDPTPSDSTAFWVNSWLLDPAIKLTAFATSDPVPAGSSIGYRVRLMNSEAAVLGATVAAFVLRPDGERYTITLSDSGSSPDSIANDGLYSGVFGSTSVPGRYIAYIAASRTASPGVTGFSRRAQLAVSASSSTSSFTGAFSNYGTDANGNGYYDSLVVSVGLQITATGRYRVIGVLSDSLGNELHVAAEGDLQAGSRQLYLRYDGRLLFDRAQNGPYEIAGLTLIEVQSNDYITVSTYTQAYQTSAYLYSVFERRSHIRLNGENTETAYANYTPGRYDKLLVNIGVDVDSTAAYRYSAILTDSTGFIIDWFDGTTLLQPGGAASAYLEFDGELIGSHGVDGPYQVRDFTMFRGPHLIFTTGNILSTQPYSVFEFEGSPPPSDRLYIKGTFVYDDSLYGANRAIPCNLIVAYDTKDDCAGCDSTALDSLKTAQVTWRDDGGFVIGPLLNVDSDNDQGPLDIMVRVYLKNNEACWNQEASKRYTINMVDSTGAPWHFDSPVFRNVPSDTLDIGTVKPTDVASREALHIYKNLVENAWDRARSITIGDHRIYPESVRVVWSKGYSVNPSVKSTFYSPSSRTLYVDGRPNAALYAPDEWDDVVVNRAYGFAFAQALGVLASAAGSADACVTTSSDSLAWNGGLATFFAKEISGPSSFLDHGYDGSGTTVQTVDLESGCVTPSCPGGCPNSAGVGSELAIAGALWDIHDSQKDDPNGDGFGDSISVGATWVWSTLKKTRPYVRTVRAFRDGLLKIRAPLLQNPRDNWLIRQVFLEHGIDATFTGTDDAPPVPLRLALHPGRPNPFNPRVRIQFDLPGFSKRVSLRLFNTRGQRVRTLVDQSLGPGRHEFLWNGRADTGAEQASGVYFCKLETAFGDRSIKLVLAK